MSVATCYIGMNSNRSLPLSLLITAWYSPGLSSMLVTTLPGPSY